MHLQLKNAFYLLFLIFSTKRTFYKCFSLYWQSIQKNWMKMLTIWRRTCKILRLQKKKSTERNERLKKNSVRRIRTEEIPGAAIQLILKVPSIAFLNNYIFLYFFLKDHQCTPSFSPIQFYYFFLSFEFSERFFSNWRAH